jgi:hypothetical protein
LSVADFDGRVVVIRGLLLGKGDLLGGNAWIVPDWEHRDVTETRFDILPTSAFNELIGTLPARGGGEYVLAYEMIATGRFLAGRRAFCPHQIATEIRGRKIAIHFNQDDM